MNGGNPYNQNYSTGGGGGFMASDSQGSQGGGEKKAGSESLRPVTIRQIINAEEVSGSDNLNFQIDGTAAGQVTFVGIVRNVSAFPTNISYSVSDGTGTIEVRRWIDTNADDLSKNAAIDVDSYVRVLGSIKAFQNKRSVSGGHIRLITNFNEVMFHKLDAIYTHLAILRGTGGSSSGGAAGATADTKGGAASSNKYNNIGDALQRKLMQLIDGMQVADDEEGVPVPALAKRCPGVTLDDVRTAIDNLVSDGYLYTAADDDHVLCT